MSYRFRRLAIATTFIASVSAGPLIDHLSSKAFAQPVPIDQCRPSHLSELGGKLANSRLVIIPENHSDIGFYFELIERLQELKQNHLLKTVFVELDRDLNHDVKEYLKLTRVIRAMDYAKRAERNALDAERAKHLDRILNRTKITYDPRKRGAILALLDTCSQLEIDVVFVDLSDADLAKKLGKGAESTAAWAFREQEMTSTILAAMPQEGTAIALNGAAHHKALASALNAAGLKTE
jgi:hypothetical protein